MRCPYCENENRDQAKFCDECGFPLTGAIARAAIESLPDEKDEVLVEVEEAAEEPIPVSVDEEIGIEQTQKIDVAPEDFEDEEAPEEADASEIDEPSEVFEEEDESESLDNPESFEAQQAESEIEEDEPVRAFDEQATEVIGVDLSGFDRSYDYGERLVDPGYREPTIDWRDGGTMKMPRVEGEEPPKSRDYLESSKKKRSNKPKIIAGIAAGVVIVAALVAFATYQMELWGGIAIPNVTGMTEADASSILEDEGFSVRSTKVKSDDTEGLVLVMDPDAGSRAEEGSEVIIHISTARMIPSVVGKTEQEAASAMEEEGFTNVKYEKQFSDEKAGTVLSIVPEQGTRAKSAQEIIVKVAEPYTVPAIAGMYLEEAQTTIEQAGLTYDYQYVNTVDYPEGSILGSYPEAGTQVTGDTVVVIQIARARGAELEGLTRTYLAPGNSVTIGINNYAIETLDSVEYIGNDTVTYTMTARPFTYIMGETVSISARQISGAIVWNEDNTIASIS